MKKILLVVSCLIMLIACNNQNIAKVADVSVDSLENVNYTDTAECDSIENTTYREALNDIRFDGWTKKEWADNEYIREVRRYIDAYNKGEFENSALDAHKGYMQGKFIIADISPCLWGGAFIYFSFYDYPDKVFSAMVYSDVDEKTRVVSNYECRSLTYEDLDLNITQEEIRQFLKESPEQKMW